MSDYELLITDVCERFDVGKEFVEAIFAKTRARTDNVATYDAFVNANMDLYKHVNYVLNTNRRGKRLFSDLRKRVQKDQIRYLDIGCAYGGALIPYLRNGDEAVGIEAVSSLAMLGKINCRYFCDNPTIIEKDFLQLQDAEFGKFDIITCIDVLEHISDPPLAIRMIFGLLKDGGLAYMHIPNAWCIRNLLKDIHHSLFGMMLLPHYEAMHYYTKNTGKSYTIGEFFPLEWYTNLMVDIGFVDIKSTCIDSDVIADIPRLVSELTAEYAKWESLEDNGVDFFIKHSMRKYFSKYMEDLFRDYGKLISDNEISLFTTRYLAPAWKLGAHKMPRVD